MDPNDSLDAHQIVVEYARMLERDVNENRHPARVDSLPYAKPTIKTAIRTSARYLALSGQLTDEMRDYLENAYCLLAEYLDPELANLMLEYRESAEALSAHAVPARDKVQTAAWRTVAATGSLAGEIARETTLEAEKLREEFRTFLVSEE
jgi:hypothetical protein